MRKLIPLAALAIVTLVCSDSEASNRRIRMSSAPASGGYYAQQGDGPLARLMELERRKNAALRSMFFGR
jgi:hypothetical protein